ncbi:hypothetical protein [Brevundimonas aveniformis]|uniref:hypothetical protein n=1 Tax=Brevundimonas aveniformis TaxID=370977 RepID=UPI00248F65D8|nr:hypothetical protein [Brevundimonas aveniformis]
MSNRELRAWGDLITTVLIWGTYFVHFSQGVASGDLARQGFVSSLGGHLAAALILSIVAAFVVSLVVNLVRRDTPTQSQADREAWAGLRATRLAHGVIITLLMILTALALALGAFAGPALADQVDGWLGRSGTNGLILFAHAGLAILILAELVHYGALIVLLGRDRR